MDVSTYTLSLIVTVSHCLSVPSTGRPLPVVRGTSRSSGRFRQAGCGPQRDAGLGDAGRLGSGRKSTKGPFHGFSSGVLFRSSLRCSRRRGSASGAFPCPGAQELVHCSRSAPRVKSQEARPSQRSERRRESPGSADSRAGAAGARASALARTALRRPPPLPRRRTGGIRPVHAVLQAGRREVSRLACPFATNCPDADTGPRVFPLAGALDGT